MSPVSTFATVGLALLAMGLGLSGARALDTLLPGGGETTWRYLDDGTDPGGDWVKGEFDDSAWKKGVAPLGYGEPMLGTTVEFGPDETGKAATVFFRVEFTVKKEALSGFENLGFRLRRDDGAVVYLNGIEVFRSNMPEGKSGAKVWASRALGAPEEAMRLTETVPPKKLKAGKNSVAVEVHQAGPSSSDLYFDLEIVGYGKGETPARDFLAEAQRALGLGDIEEGARLLVKVPPDSPDYPATMAYLGHELYATRLGQPKKGLPFVKKAYAAAPEDMSVVRAYIRTHVLAREGLSVDTSKRKHATGMPEKYAYLGTEYDWGRQGPRISGAKLLQDLDYLEEMLANCYSYLERRGADWESALDALRLSVKDGTTRRSFTWKLARFLHIFGDAHTRLGIPMSSMLPRGYASFGAGISKGKVFLFKPDRSAFLDPDHPYVRSMDGVGIEKWMKAARANVVKASDQWSTRVALEMLSSVGYLREDLGIELPGRNPDLTVLLESEDGKKTRELTLPVRSRPVFVEDWPALAAEIMADDIGYLPIRSMRSDQNHLRGLKKSMENFRETKGLIIDVRGNGGGSQDTLKTMLPYFLKPGDPMKIVNVAAYRMPMKLPEPNPSGFLGLYGRGLHPAASKVWSQKERTQIEKFLGNFEPSWKLPAGKFSNWHVMAVRRGDNPDAYYYGKPVVVLSDAGSFSATDNFLGSFKGHHNVTIIGETSGGGSGRMQRYTLPNTGLTLTLCQMASYSANGRLIEGNGVLPDVVLLPSAENLVGRGDLVLEAALKRLSGGGAAE